MQKFISLIKHTFHSYGEPYEFGLHQRKDCTTTGCPWWRLIRSKA